MRIAPKPKPGQEVRLEELLKDNKKIQTRAAGTNEFSIKMGTDSMTLTGVKVQNLACEIEISNKILPYQDNQSEFIADGQRRVIQGDFRPASSEEAYAILSSLVEVSQPLPLQFGALYTLAQEGLEYIQGLWEGSLFYMYSTYQINPRGILDCVTHLHGTEFQTPYHGDLAGPDGLIKNPTVNASSACQILFGESDTQKVNQAFYKLFKQDLMIARAKSPDFGAATGIVKLGNGMVAAGGGISSRIPFPSLGIKTTALWGQK